MVYITILPYTTNKNSYDSVNITLYGFFKLEKLDLVIDPKSSVNFNIHRTLTFSQLTHLAAPQSAIPFKQNYLLKKHPFEVPYSFLNDPSIARIIPPKNLGSLIV